MCIGTHAVPNFSRLPCVVLRVTVEFARASLSLPDAEEAYRGALKAGLERDALSVLDNLFEEPETGMKAQGERGSNMFVPGIALSAGQYGAVRSSINRQSLEIKLFGRAGAYAPHVLWALAQGMAHDGLGSRRLPARVKGVEVWSPDQGWQTVRMLLLNETEVVADWQHPVDVLGAVLFPKPLSCEVGISLRKRMLLKKDGNVVQHAPQFGFLLERIVQRANQVALRWGDGEVLSSADWGWYEALTRQVHVDERSQVLLAHKTVKPKGYSSQGYPSHGLRGVLWYRAESPEVWPPLLPWLFAGRVLHVGQQTTMGLGSYDLEFGIP